MWKIFAVPRLVKSHSLGVSHTPFYLCYTIGGHETNIAELDRPWGGEKSLTRLLSNWSGTAKVDVSYFS